MALVIVNISLNLSPKQVLGIPMTIVKYTHTTIIKYVSIQLNSCVNLSLSTGVKGEEEIAEIQEEVNKEKEKNTERKRKSRQDIEGVKREEVN